VQEAVGDADAIKHFPPPRPKNKEV